MDLLLATSNLHKVRELRFFLKYLNFIDCYSLRDFPHYSPPIENGATFEENAILKARSAAVQLGLWTLADDSGLVVPALKGAPGIFSARFAGNEATDKENRKKLLQEMRHLEGVSRSAYFECSLVLAEPSGTLYVSNATCEGWIAQEEKGSQGFGYDPLFIKHDYSQTFAELDEGVKNQISHRAKAFAKILTYFSSVEKSEK